MTICSKDKQCIFGTIVGAGVLDRPNVRLTELGNAVFNAIEFQFQKGVIVDKFVVMPNHVHLLIAIDDQSNGRSGTPAPTVGQIVGQLKSYVTKQAGFEVWQKGFYDHIIRDQKDYDNIWNYIDTNPDKWQEDKNYTL